MPSLRSTGFCIKCFTLHINKTVKNAYVSVLQVWPLSQMAITQILIGETARVRAQQCDNRPSENCLNNGIKYSTLRFFLKRTL